MPYALRSSDISCPAPQFLEVHLCRRFCTILIEPAPDEFRVILISPHPWNRKQSFSSYTLRLFLLNPVRGLNTCSQRPPNTSSCSSTNPSMTPLTTDSPWPSSSDAAIFPLHHTLRARRRQPHPRGAALKHPDTHGRRRFGAQHYADGGVEPVRRTPVISRLWRRLCVWRCCERWRRSARRLIRIRMPGFGSMLKSGRTPKPSTTRVCGRSRRSEQGPAGAHYACLVYSVKDRNAMHALYSSEAAKTGGVFHGLRE
ncbi:hypothetical protein B0H14DRAFT_1272067 [Mycena olivaceomarginata]|nr:hypothetical protein B0H14DRAFT_1272067 [Mycena olivaceomarginata]